MIDTTNSSDFIEDLRLLSLLYKEVKQIVLLAETVNEENAVLLTAVNELRNSFDHVMRCYLDECDYKKHIDKAKGHLYRAGYDAYELMAIDIFVQIKELLKDRNISAVTIVLPEYYKTLLPRMNELEQKLMYARSNKKPESIKKHNLHNIDSLLEQEFKQYSDIVAELMQIQQQVTEQLPTIIEYEDKLHKNHFMEQKLELQTKIKNYVVYLLGSISIIVAIASWFMD